MSTSSLIDTQGSGLPAGEPGTPTIVQRAAAILRDEIAGGALANVAASNRLWSSRRPDFLAAETSRRLRSDLEAVLEAVLDLLAPRSETLTELRSPDTPAPGQTTEIRTRLANDTAKLVELEFTWSDLIAAPDKRIQAEHLHVSPGHVRIPAGAVVDVQIGLQVPAGARPGHYRGLLQATNIAGLRARLTFQVV